MARITIFFLVALLNSAFCSLYAQTAPVFGSTPVEAGVYFEDYLYEIETLDGTENDTRTISITTGVLPLGLTFTDDLDGTATISGRLEETGTFPITLTVQETSGGLQFATQSFTINVSKAVATVTLSGLDQGYDGSDKTVTVTTSPAGLSVDVLYNASAVLPRDAGSYSVEATVVDDNYQGTASNTLIIRKAAAIVSLENLNQNFDGQPKPVTVSTDPAGLSVITRYDGDLTVPVAAGTYAVLAEIDETNYEGSAMGNLLINGAPITTGIADINVLEDAPNATVDLNAAFEDTEDNDQDLIFNVESNSNTALFDDVALAAGVLTLDFAENIPGSSSLVIRATDSGGLFVEESFEVTVEAVNDAPSFVKGSDITLDEDAGPQVFTGWATLISPGGGMDESGQTLVFEVNIANATPNLTFSIPPAIDETTGDLSFTTAPNANGLATLEVFLRDSGPGDSPNNNQSPVQSFTLTVNDVNDVPSFSLSTTSLTVSEDFGGTQVIEIIPGPIPTDEIGQSVDYTLNSNGNFASVQVDVPTGEIRITSKTDLSGTQEFTITANDGGAGGTFEQNFTVVVNPVNDAPAFSVSTSLLEVDEDFTGVQTIHVTPLPVPPGEEDQNVTYRLSPDPSTVSFAEVTINANSGQVDIQAVPNAPGDEVFTVIADDGEPVNGTASQNFRLKINPINDAPGFTKGSNITVLEDAGLRVFDPWATGINPGGGDDENGQELTFFTSVVSGDLSFAQEPEITRSGQLSFTAADNAFGEARVEVYLQDDGPLSAPNNNKSPTESFTINVTAQQDPPVFTSAPVTGAIQGELYEYLVEASDPDPTDVLTIINALVLPTWLSLDDNGDGTALLSGTPTNSDIGTVGIALEVSDGAGGRKATQLFNIAVSNSNDPPYFTSLPIEIATEGINYIYNITTGDDDIDDELTITAPVKPTWLTLVNGVDGKAVLSGTPANDDVGPNTVKLVVMDKATAMEEQEFVITVDNANDAPSFNSVPVTTAIEDSPYSYQIIATDPDPGDAMEIRVLAMPAWLTLTPGANGEALLSGTPLNENVGSASIVLNVRDGDGANVNQNFTLVVSNTNDAPEFTTAPVEAALQGVEYFYAISTSDPDAGDSRTITAINLPGWLTLTDNGNGTATLAGTPSNDDFGPNVVELVVTDLASAVDEQRFAINVDNVNDPPSFTSDPVTTGTEDVLYTYSIVASDPDANDRMTITALSIPGWLNLTDNGRGGAELSGTPTNDDVGSFSIVLNVKDAIGAEDNQGYTLTISNTNDKPAFTSEPLTAAFQDIEYIYNVQATDIDNGDQATISAVTLPSWLSLDVTGSGSATLRGTPTNANLGDATARLRATDESDEFVDQVFTITVNNANDPPSIISEPETNATEDDLYTYEIQTFDPDERDELEIKALVLPRWLVLTDNGNGTADLIGTPLNEDVGLSSVVISVEDAGGATANQNFTISVANTNDPPLFASSPVTGAIQDVNYRYNISTSDPDAGDTRSITEVSLPGWLTLTDNGNGSATLEGVPANANRGSNPVVIRVIDLALASVDQSFVINVDDTNDPPEFTSDPVITAVEDQNYSYNITTTDPDIRDTRDIRLLSGPSWLQLTDNDDGTALLTGVPLNDDIGTATVVINVVDAVGANVNQNFTITVTNTNDPPAFTSVPLPVAVQDITYIYSITTLDPDAGDTRTIEATTVPGWLNFEDNGNGTAVLQGTPSNANLGSHDVVLAVEDRAGVVVEQVFKINVDNSNDPPVFTSSPVTNATEDNLYTYNIATEDPDESDIGIITALSIPTWLDLVDNGNGAMVLTGTPLNEDVGSVNVVLNVRDGIGASENQDFTITVENTNDAPSFTSSPRTGAIQDINYRYDITVADVDAMETLTIEAIVIPGWASFSSNGSTALLEGTPANDDLGSNEVVLRVTDGIGASVDQQFTINVDNQNDPPTFSSEAITSIDEDDNYIYNVSTSDPDDNDTRTITALSLPSWLSFDDNEDGTGVLSGVPTNENVGDHPVVLEVVDAIGASERDNFTIVVNNTNDAPSFNSIPPLSAIQGLAYTYSINTADPDVGDNLAIEATTLPGWLRLVDNGDGTATLEGTASNANLGEHPVVLKVTDDAPIGASAEQRFTIQVDNTNDPPVFTSAPVELVAEDDPYTYEVTTTDPDTGDELTLTGLDIPNWLTFTDNGNGRGTLIGLPTNAQVGTHQVRLQVSDGSQVAVQEYAITVTNTNDAPVITSAARVTADEDDEYQYVIAFTDDDLVSGDIVTLSTGDLPGWLTFDAAETTLSGTPLNDDVGNYTIRITAQDRTGALDVQEFELTVLNTNDPPVFLSSGVTSVDEDSPYNYAIRADDEDVGDVLTITSGNLPSWLTLQDNTDGTALLSGVPTNDNVGTHTITITVEDQASSEVSQIFAITVANTNDAPAFTSTPRTRVALNENYVYTIETIDVDAGDQVTIRALTLPSYLSFSDNGDGTAQITGVITSQALNDRDVVVRVEDQMGTSVEQSFSIVVNTPPSLSGFSLEINEDNPYSFNASDFSLNFSDADGDDIQFVQVVSLPSHGTLQSANGEVSVGDNITVGSDVPLELVYTPGLNFNGSDDFSWNGFDGVALAENAAQINISVLSINDAPVLENIENTALAYSLGDPGVPVTSTITINDVDNTFIQGAVVSIVENFTGGDLLTYEDELNVAISAEYNAGQGILTLTGEDTRSNYEIALGKVLFSSPVTGNTNLLTKRLQVVVNDGLVNSQPATRLVDITEIFPELDIVNAFTPNNDGVNDQWDFLNLQFYTQIEIAVFNQDGLKVFECGEQGCTWDGTYEGTELPAGPYFYTILLNDGKREYKGTVTILK